jgi:hypothetical protein
MAANAVIKFLNAAKSLANQGMSKDAIMQFAKNEFGQINELFQKQIDNIFKPRKGIENIKIKDEVFDDTVIKLPIDNTGAPFNPNNPLKDYSKKPRDKKYTGGMVDVEPNLSDIGHGSDALMARTRLVSPGSQSTTSTGLNYLLAEDNDNIRVPFSDGKNFEMYLREREGIEKKQNMERLYKEYIEDMRRQKVRQQKQEAAEGGRIGFSKGKLALADAARRKFLKTAGSMGAGLAALKTGLLAFGKEAAPVVEKTVETVQGTPQYFLDLISKIKMFGKPGISTGPRQTTMNYKNYELMEDVTTGDLRVTKQKGSPEIGYEEEVMEFRKGQRTEDGVIPDEYDEVTIRPDGDGKMKDFEDGIEPDSIKEIIEESVETITKKAEGGRIGYSKGKGVMSLLQFLNKNNPYQAYKKYLQSVKERAQTNPKALVPELAAVASGGIFVNRRAKDALENMMTEDKEVNYELFKQELENDPFYKDYPDLKDKILNNYVEKEFGNKKAFGGLAQMVGE